MQIESLPEWEPLQRILTSAGATPDASEVRRAAAMLGPGWSGRRANLAKEDAQRAAQEILRAWSDAELGDAPAYLIQAASGDALEWRDRRAKLFEIGEYDDRGLRVTQEDVVRLAQSFDSPVPILVEHVETPLRLGYLTQVEAAGGELFGNLALTPEADDLIEKSGAKSLSISVSRDLDRIFEVSIVANPRIESARLFCEDFRQTSLARDARREVVMLRRELDEAKANALVESLLREGRIAPVSRDAAMRLLASARAAGCFEQAEAFFTSLPKAIQFGEVAPAAKPANLPDEVAQFYRTHFPDLDLSEIEKRRTA
ncbi:MAG: hypothetical protein AKCLJLPJ_01584 [Fimbriimonadales bacterium]|nr:hypothetical protein [Fimbriimonadales bacterium]